MKKMKNKLEFDVRRMLSLLEATPGDVKPIIVEGEQYLDEYHIDGELNEVDDEDEDIIKKLSRVELNFAEQGCKRPASKNDLLLPGEEDGSWGTIGPDVLKAIDQPQQTIIKDGDKAITMKCGGEGIEYDILVTNHRSPNDPEQLVALQVQKDKAGKKTYLLAQKKFPGLLSKVESYVSDEANLNADQKATLDAILSKPGINAAGTEITRDLNVVANATNYYTPIDLSTGKGLDGQQYLDVDILNPSGLDQIFKRPGRYYVWARKAVKDVQTNVPKDVEDMLADMDYTADRNKLPNYKGSGDERVTKSCGAMTVTEFCAGGACDGYPDLVAYIEKFGGGAQLYPKVCNREKAQVSLGVTKGDTKKAMRDIAKEGATRKSCRALINIYDAIINGGMTSDGDIADVLTSSGYQTDSGGVPSIMDQLGKLLVNCTQSWRNVNLNKKDLRKIDVFVNSSHKYGPKSAEVRAAAKKAEEEASGGTTSPLAESISKSIRTVLKEHTKPNSDDMIKKAIRNNIKRFL